MNPLMPVDTSWFDRSPETYLQREEFLQFQDVADVDFRNLLSEDPHRVQEAQEKIVSQSKILNEIRNEHSGYSMPFLTYTQDFSFAEPIEDHNLKLDQLILSYDIIDSLRRRHMALSHAILPNEIRRLSDLRSGNDLVIKNLGSGVGLDVINAVTHTNSYVRQVWNYDINPVAIGLGKRITQYLKERGDLNENTVAYRKESFLRSREKADIVLLIGVICGMTDRAASLILKAVYRNLRGGAIVSSSNINMVEKDPIGPFIVQHLGSPHDPFGDGGSISGPGIQWRSYS
ncbi:MAG: class I SAM-dependent methyltransferase [Deltaproteobacteria bacterium]|nr:class I SAM-dependent methyltransferase [Deltaproteobacteria bacterium]